MKDLQTSQSTFNLYFKDVMKEKMDGEKDKSFELSLPHKNAKDYNRAYDKMKVNDCLSGMIFALLQTSKPSTLKPVKRDF